MGNSASGNCDRDGPMGAKAMLGRRPVVHGLEIAQLSLIFTPQVMSVVLGLQGVAVHATHGCVVRRRDLRPSLRTPHVPPTTCPSFHLGVATVGAVPCEPDLSYTTSKNAHVRPRMLAASASPY